MGQAAAMPERSEKQRRVGGFIVEFWQVGGAVKVSAIDPVTLTEVSIVGPPSAGDAVLEQTVLRKLKYVLNKRQPQPPKRGGTLA